MDFSKIYFELFILTFDFTFIHIKSEDSLSHLQVLVAFIISSN